MPRTSRPTPQLPDQANIAVDSIYLSAYRDWCIELVRICDCGCEVDPGIARTSIGGSAWKNSAVPPTRSRGRPTFSGNFVGGAD
jgi:hypothetical protein